MVSIVGTFIFTATLVSFPHINKSYARKIKKKICELIQMGVVINIITERYLFGWRISLFVQVIVSIILIVGTIFLPETPR